MNEKTRNFLVNRFRGYYSQAEIHLPPEHISREWGFISFRDSSETFMKRHIAFGSEGEITDYLKGIAPAHAYYSIAYYEYPSAPKMKEKNWQKADLIFDIDSDHLPGKITSYADMLEKGKKETFKLMAFLLDDFGFDEKDVHIVFSGGRGYHCHITDPSVLHLESPERREIVDYVSGNFNVESFLGKEIMIGQHGEGTETFGGKTSAPSKWVINNYDSGWGKRIVNYISTYLKEEATKENKEMFRDLRHIKGLGKTTSKTFNELKKIASNDNALNDIRNKGRLDFGHVPDFKEIIENLINQAKDKSKIYIGSTQLDEPVTADIKRLIRLPGSLHGGSGLKVMSLNIDDLEKFEPLTDAVVFGERLVRLKVIKPFAVQMKGKDIEVEPGGQELPEYAAVHLLCRGVAEYG